MCERGTSTPMFINDEWGGQWWNIDKCIWLLVQMLLESGVYVINACCGHNDRPVQILFEKGENNSSYDIVNGLNPSSITPPDKPGRAIAEWNDFSLEDIHGDPELFAGSNNKKGPCISMYIIRYRGERKFADWWGNVEKPIAPLIQMLRELGVCTANSCCGHGERPMYIWLDKTKDGIAHEIVKKLNPDSLTPIDADGYAVAKWKNLPLKQMYRAQKEIAGYS